VAERGPGPALLKVGELGFGAAGSRCVREGPDSSENEGIARVNRFWGEIEHDWDAVHFFTPFLGSLGNRESRVGCQRRGVGPSGGRRGDPVGTLPKRKGTFWIAFCTRWDREVRGI
jgi:hypothetical protein